MKTVTRIEDFQDAYVGQRCFVIGNDPGLLKLDWDLMQGEYTFATNRIAALWNHVIKTDWRPTFFVLTSNQMLARKQWREDCVDALTDSQASFVYTINRRVIPPELHGGIWWLENCLHESMHDAEVPDEFFSINPAEWISKFGTSFLPMMQLAVWMGFDPIYIVGCDEGFIGYDNATMDDPNHFYKNYDGDGYSFGSGPAGSVMRRVPAAHRLVKRVTEKLGVEVYNAGLGKKPGMIDDIYERVEFGGLFDE